MRMALKRKQRKHKGMKGKQIHSRILSKIVFRYNDSKSELQAPAISERQICWFCRKGRNWSSKNLTNPYRTPHTSPRDQILQQSPERNEILKRPKTKRVAPPTCPFIRSPAHSTFRNEVEGIGKKDWASKLHSGNTEPVESRIPIRICHVQQFNSAGYADSGGKLVSHWQWIRGIRLVVHQYIQEDRFSKPKKPTKRKYQSTLFFSDNIAPWKTTEITLLE